MLDQGSFKTLLNSVDISAVKKRFEDGILTLYEDAKRRHENVISTGMPWWGWLVIAYTGYDDIWRLVTSSIFFPLIIIIFGAFFIMNYMGMTGPINQVYYLVYDIVMKQFFKKKFT